MDIVLTIHVLIRNAQILQTSTRSQLSGRFFYINFRWNMSDNYLGSFFSVKTQIWIPKRPCTVKNLLWEGTRRIIDKSSGWIDDSQVISDSDTCLPLNCDMNGAIKSGNVPNFNYMYDHGLKCLINTLLDAICCYQCYNVSMENGFILKKYFTFLWFINWEVVPLSLSPFFRRPSISPEFRYVDS